MIDPDYHPYADPMTGADTGEDDVPPPAEPVPSIHPYPRFGDRAKERERGGDPAEAPEGERHTEGESPSPEGD